MTSRGSRGGGDDDDAHAGGSGNEAALQDPSSLAKATLAAHMRRAVAGLPKSCASVRVLSRWRRDPSQRLAPLDAVCALIEAARERGATNVNILLEQVTEVRRRRSECLFVCDDAPGLSPLECRDFFRKGSRSTFRFLHSSMSLGVDVMLFTKTADNRCSAVLLAPSATDAFPKREVMDAAVPVAHMSWQLSDDGKYSLIEPQQQRARNNHVLLLDSPFSTLSRLLRQFDRIPGEGTVVCVCGLHRASPSSPSSPALLLRRGRDIVVPRVADKHVVATEPPLSMLTMTEPRTRFNTSLRHRLSLLYLHPRVDIHLCSSRVEPHHPWGALESPKIISCPLDGSRAAVDVVCGVNAPRRWDQGLLVYLHGKIVARISGVGPQVANAPWDQDACGGVVAVVDLAPPQLSTGPDPSGRIAKKDLRDVCRTVANVLPHYWQWFKQQHGIATQRDLDDFWLERGYPSPSSWAHRDGRLMQEHTHRQCRRCRCWKRVPTPSLRFPDAPIASNSGSGSDRGAQGRSCLCAALSQDCGTDDLAGVSVERDVMQELTSHALDRAFAAILSRESCAPPQPVPHLQDVSDSDSDIDSTNAGRGRRSETDAAHVDAIDEGLEMITKNDASREREPSEASSTTAIVTTAPWMPPEVVAIKNLKRLLLTLVPAEEMKMVAGVSVDDFKVGTFQTMLKVKADAAIASYHRSRDRFQRRLSDNLKAIEERAATAEQRVQMLLTGLQPMLTALNGGVEPSLDTADADQVVAVISLLADGCDQLDPRWMLMRVASKPKPPSRMSSRRRR